MSKILQGPGNFRTVEEYRKYVEEDVFGKHGGAVGARVRFVQDGDFFGITQGMRGRVIEFESTGSFWVDWGSIQRCVSIDQCLVMETSDGELRLSEAAMAS